MTNVRMPQGESLPLHEIISGLANDDIEIKKPDSKIINLLSKYFTSNVTKKIVANRYKDVSMVEKYFNTKLHDILNIEFIEKWLPDVSKSTPIINDVIAKGGKIVLVIDSDSDGVTSGAISHKMLNDVFHHDDVEVFVNKRADGNGINTVLTGLIIKYCEEEEVSLIVGSDHGSNDRVNVTKIMDVTKVPVIITDHHLFNKEDAPFNAEAFINPQRYENNILADMTGTGVVYFTLLHARLIKGNVTKEELDKIYYLLTYVGLTLISDCMDLKNYINRKILIKTLTDINNMKIKHDPFWELIIAKNKSTYLIDETTLGYNVIPMLNSPGRIADARFSYELIMSPSLDIANMLYEDVKEINTKRKELQTKALAVGKKEEYTDGIVKVMVVEESDGVQGIIANNVMYDDGYKIVIVFTRQRRHDGYILVGSGRNQEDGLNLKDVVTAVSTKSDFIIKFGGHKGAIGIKMKDNLKEFFDLLKTEASRNKVEEKKTTYIEDYIFSTKKLLLTLFDVINAGPFGIGYEKPLYCSDLYIESYRIYKRSTVLLNFKVKFSKNAASSMGVFYSIKKSELAEVEEKLKSTKFIRLTYSFNVNSFRNQNKIQLQPTKLIFK
ncbi:hypothetical protein DRJ25_02305 [Candidatus Woesearchaeota archaeon]|nr:MAG: hypothetical protein DRJ25_02305 [Candidatus Woesearchaeota archaeon]